ncbi:MAG: type II secretion system F family protein [Planctomycetota bacterium]
MNFTYQARQAGGGTSAGTIEAVDLAEARRLLRGRGLFPTAVTEAVRVGQEAVRTRTGRSTVGREQLADATAEMALMVRSGVDVAEAVRAIGERNDGSPICDVMRTVYESIASGALASAAFAQRRDVFNEAYVASVAAGEASGNVAETFERLAELMRHEIELAATVRGILAYPVVLVGACGVVLLVAILFVLPQFAEVFDDLDRPPPAVTEALLTVALFARAHLSELSAVAVATVAVAVLWLRSAGGKRWVDDAYVSIPRVGDVAKKLLTARLFRQLGMLLRGGLPLLEAVRLCRLSTGHVRFRELLEAIEAEVLTGGAVGVVLDRTPEIPRGAARMVHAAEASGSLGEVIDDVGRRYEADGRRELAGLAKVIEPVVVLVMGVLVGGVVMSVMLPLLDMTASAGGV